MLKRWIWLSFRISVDQPFLGVLRVYVLPDDIGRAAVDRSVPQLRKARATLFSLLDYSKSTWSGKPGIDHSSCPALFHAAGNEDTGETLLEMFNNMPSPDPHPELLSDETVKECALALMESNVPGLKTELYPYQRRSACTMLQKEAQPERVPDSRLTKVMDQDGDPWYYDAIEGSAFRQPPLYDGVRGGILAEEMGSGKTLICLALILATRHQPSRVPEGHKHDTARRPKVGSLADMAAACITRNSVPWKLWFGGFGEDGIEHQKCVEAIRRNPGFYIPHDSRERKSKRGGLIPQPVKVCLSSISLIVVPLNLVQQWKQEITKHTYGLKVLVLVSRLRIPPIDEILEYDIILLSSTRAESLWTEVTVDRFGSYRVDSALGQVKFKRCIVDEGHKLGNSTTNNKSHIHLLLDCLHIEARWIVTGTPSKGLFGADLSPANSLASTPDDGERRHVLDTLTIEQEREDLKRIGSIATLYLRARPWANSALEAVDTRADWSTYVIQPKHSPRNPWRKKCLRTTLESLIIRHRLADVVQLLPTVSEKMVYLDGSYQDRLSLNLFSMMIIMNAVQSQRTDEDYFFHPRQRKWLMEVIANLRQASFFGGLFFSPDDIRTAVEMAQQFLEARKVEISAEDEALLRDAIDLGQLAQKNHLKTCSAESLELPIYVQNFPGGLGKSWSLDHSSSDPVCMSIPMIHELQKYLRPTLDAPNSLEVLFSSGRFEAQGSAMTQNAELRRPAAQLAAPTSRNRSRTLAGKTQLGQESHSRQSEGTTMALGSLAKLGETAVADDSSEPIVADVLARTQIVSTASAKLSYLIDQVVEHGQNEQIIIFYEDDNVAYFIAGVLEILQIHHLIYTKRLAGVTAERRARYVDTFNHNPKFRVLLMDLSQAAFGLDMRSASRIYFVNPVLNPQVEAQAIGRARRISQQKPVTVETLVLRGSVEELIVKRREEMTQAEQRKCRSILDDKQIYQWIRNAKIMPLPGGVPQGPAQTAMLETPQFVFGRGFGREMKNPDEDLVLVTDSPRSSKGTAGETAGVRVKDDADSTLSGDTGANDMIVVSDEPSARLHQTAGRKRGFASPGLPLTAPGPSDNSSERAPRRVRFMADDHED
ncbi:hypothetical protein VTK73DRAFT_2937 [Phialemonium thermophilum]|uniref:Uncharacterized protein n=1 Tax=Phialemonium thermophilum TaxID=223376 RepID=A0ABR3X1P8_9PEZI